ncbi:MAG: helix-turn-helix domain-containing protein [Candidatus Binataceae bacterium]
MDKNEQISGLGGRRVLSVREVAIELGVSEQLVRLEIRRELLGATRFGKRILIQRAELDRYLAEREGR